MSKLLMQRKGWGIEKGGRGSTEYDQRIPRDKRKAEKGDLRGGRDEGDLCWGKNQNCPRLRTVENIDT